MGEYYQSPRHAYLWPKNETNWLNKAKSLLEATVLPKNKENEYLMKITNMVNSFKANIQKPNEF